MGEACVDDFERRHSWFVATPLLPEPPEDRPT